MPDLDLPADVEATLGQIATASATRIREADTEAEQAQLAFVAGKFEEFFQQKYEQQVEALQREYERIARQVTSGGDGQEDR